MFRDEREERREEMERRRQGIEEPDPWYGHTSTDVTHSTVASVPSHARQDGPVPCFNRSASDVTSQNDGRPNSPAHGDYYYGRTDTDVTRHLQVPVPKFVNPYGQNNRRKKGHITPERAHAYDGRAFDLMHPLGTHRPFPLSDLYFHGVAMYGAPKRRSRSPSPSRRPRSRSPSPSSPRNALPAPGGSPRRRSRSPPRSALLLEGNRSRSPTPPRRRSSRSRSRSRSPNPRRKSRSTSPSVAHSYSHLPQDHRIPLRYLQCPKRCQLCPPCDDCTTLLYNDQRGSRSSGSRVQFSESSAQCPFHGPSLCPFHYGLPCYGERSWSPSRNSSSRMSTLTGSSASGSPECRN